jgi:FtsZ-interacting cell division protein ZipA
MGIRTIIVMSILAMAFAVVVVFIWLGQRQQQKRLRNAARYNRQQQKQSRHDAKAPSVIEVNNKRVIVDPLVADFDEEDLQDDDLQEDNNTFLTDEIVSEVRVVEVSQQPNTNNVKPATQYYSAPLKNSEQLSQNSEQSAVISAPRSMYSPAQSSNPNIKPFSLAQPSSQQNPSVHQSSEQGQSNAHQALTQSQQGRAYNAQLNSQGQSAHQTATQNQQARGYGSAQGSQAQSAHQTSTQSQQARGYGSAQSSQAQSAHQASTQSQQARGYGSAQSSQGQAAHQTSTQSQYARGYGSSPSSQAQSSQQPSTQAQQASAQGSSSGSQWQASGSSIQRAAQGGQQGRAYNSGSQVPPASRGQQARAFSSQSRLQVQPLNSSAMLRNTPGQPFSAYGTQINIQGDPAADQQANSNAQTSGQQSSGFGQTTSQYAGEHQQHHDANTQHAESQSTSQPAAEKTASALPDYLTFSLMAEKGSSFGGYDLLQSILGTGMRHGERQIFHRYDPQNHSKILFSLASIAKPGTFSLDSMGAFSTPGLIFIFELDRTPDLLNTFELLLATARQLCDELDGNLLDDRRQPLTTERIQALREQLREITPVSDFADDD